MLLLWQMRRFPVSLVRSERDVTAMSSHLAPVCSFHRIASRMRVSLHPGRFGLAAPGM